MKKNEESNFYRLIYNIIDIKQLTNDEKAKLVFWINVRQNQAGEELRNNVPKK